MLGPHPNPDCVAGKHTACAGDGWCFVEDTLTRCSCSCHSPESSDLGSDK